MKNKKVIPYKNQLKAGTFTMLPNNLLNDNKLKLMSFKLLLSILSDSDEFTLSQTMYCNRLGISDRTFKNCIKDLEENGYVKRSNIGKTHFNFYTISIYGNLNKETPEKTPESEPQETPPSNSKKNYGPQIAEFVRIHTNIIYMDDVKPKAEEINEKYGHTYRTLQELRKLVEKKQKEIINSKIEELKEGFYSEKKLPDYIKIIEDLVYEQNQIDFKIEDVKKLREKNKIKTNRMKLDFEDIDIDDDENPMD